MARRSSLDVVIDKARAVNDAYAEVEKLAKRQSPEAKAIARELDQQIKKVAKPKRRKKRG